MPIDLIDISLVDFVFAIQIMCQSPGGLNLIVFTQRQCASMKMSKFELKHSPRNRHMICIGKTKSTSEKGLFILAKLLNRSQQ